MLCGAQTVTERKQRLNPGLLYTLSGSIFKSGLATMCLTCVAGELRYDRQWYHSFYANSIIYTRRHVVEIDVTAIKSVAFWRYGSIHVVIDARAQTVFNTDECIDHGDLDNWTTLRLTNVVAIITSERHDPSERVYRVFYQQRQCCPTPGEIALPVVRSYSAYVCTTIGDATSTGGGPNLYRLTTYSELGKAGKVVTALNGPLFKNPVNRWGLEFVVEPIEGPTKFVHFETVDCRFIWPHVFVEPSRGPNTNYWK